MAVLPAHLLPGPVGRDPLPRKVMTQRQRQRALAAAIELFARNGYAATTVDELVEAAGMGVGSFYSLFGGKEGCLLAAFDGIVWEARLAAEEAAVAETWPEQICQGLRRLLTWIGEEPLPARVVLVEIQTAGPEAIARYEDVLAQAAAMLARGRELAAPGVRLPPSLEMTTVNGVAWLLHRRLTMDEGEGVPDLFEELASLVLEPYLGEEQATRFATKGQVLAAT